MSLFDVVNTTLATKIADALGKYHTGLFTKRVLKTTAEVEANTNPKNLPSAVVVGELINDLGLATRQNPDDPTKAQWRPRGSSGEWVNFTNPISLTGTWRCGYASPGVGQITSLMTFKNCKLTIDVEALYLDTGYSPGSNFVSVVTDGVSKKLPTGTSTYEGENITISLGGSGHSSSAPGFKGTITIYPN